MTNNEFTISIIDGLLNPSQLMLIAGEISPRELRTVKAVLEYLKGQINNDYSEGNATDRPPTSTYNGDMYKDSHR